MILACLYYKQAKSDFSRITNVSEINLSPLKSMFCKNLNLLKKI